MSKIYDVEKMYGQDFSIVTTNAPSNIIKQTTKLLSNTLLISSPKNEKEDSDNNMPAMFVTDYDGQSLQLTYPFCMINGLNCHENGYLYINIDNSTIKTEYSEGKGKLTVDTNNLSNAGFNKKGVVKLSNTLTGINRNLTQNYGIEQSISDKYDDSTFISINNEGTLYLNNDFLTLVNSIVDLKIKQKLDSIKVMLNNNLKMWINITNVSGNSKNETINVNESTYSIKPDDSTTLTFDLYFLSFNDEPEKINIEDKTDKIYRIEFEDDLHLTTVTQFQDNEELYQHCLKNVTLTFLPNFFIENNETYKQNIELSINVGNDQSQKLTFQQEKIDNNVGISLSDNELSVNEIVNKVNDYKITETINFGSFKNVTLNGKDVINYKIHTFIANNINSNHYELFDMDNYQIKDNNNKIVFESMSNDTETRLYAFISSIINKDKLSENEDDKYYINVDNNHAIIINSNNDKENIDNYINVEYVNQEKEYSLKLGTNIIISTDNNLNLGTFTQVIPIKLNINRKSLYGYIYITRNDISADINNKPACIYYKENYNDIDYKCINNIDYNGQDINTTKLIGIWENINTNSLDSNNNILLNIKYTDFKKYNAIDNTNDVTIDDINSIYFEHNNLIYTTNNYTPNDSSSNNILSIGLLYPESIVQMLYNGLSLKIKYDNNKDLSLIKSQTFNMYINMLNSVLNYIKFNDTNDSINTNVSNIGINSPKYYSMDRYIISNDNNNINNIKISLPDYIKYLLKNDINTSFIITFVFYKFINGNPEIVNYELEFKFSGETINVYPNDSTNQNNFIIVSNNDGDNKDNPKFELKSYNNSLLPKLLMILCNIKGKESKISYIKDTYRCNGGNLSDNSSDNYISQKLLHSDDSVLYDIVYVPNSSESSIKDIIGGISNIQISNLDLSGKNIIFNNGKTITDTDFNTNFALLINNNQQYDKAELGSLYKTNFEFNYLINPENKLDDYNFYSSTPIDGSLKIIDTGYKIRFSEVILNQKKSTNNIDNIFIDLENSIKYIICWNTSISFEYLYDNILSQIYNIKINNNINNLTQQNVTLCTITNGNISKATELLNNFDYKLCIDKLQLPYSDNNVNITNLLFNETFRFKDIKWYGGYFGPTKQEFNNNDYTYNININLNNNESQQFTWHNINLNDIDIQLELIKIYVENVIDNATGTPKNLINDPNYSYESETLSLSEITLDYLTELSQIYDNNININQQFIFQVHVKYDNIKTVKIDNQYIYINWGTTIINPLSSGDIYFYNNSDGNNPHTHINSFIFNNTTYNNEIKLHYDNTKISSVTIKLQDNSNNSIVTSNKPIVITEGTNEYTFTLSSNYTNNTQYNIICEAKGKTEGERYHDQTIICTVGIMFNQSLIDSNLFNWNTTDTTINYTSDPNDLNNQLPTLTNTTGKSVAYTIQYLGDNNDNYPTINKDTLNCLKDTEKRIDISNVTSSEDNQTFTYKIIATIQGYDNYVTTSRETFINIVIPGTNTPEGQTEGGTSGNSGNNGE